jgi:peptidoglycan/LPS O-acetylase OafA/YrhL
MGKGRIASLDGLRAISIAFVIACHAVKVMQVNGRLPFGAGLLGDWGSVGVTVFFVISGFLITTLLCDEVRETGAISLPSFYARRAFRILPAYWTYLAFVAVLSAAGVISASPAGFAEAISFVTDYRNPDSWTLGHSWSLSVEEQFYLLWPFALAALGFARARRVAIALLILAPALRILIYLFAPEARPMIGGMLHTRIDALMFGCWAGLERQARPGSSILRALASPAVAAAAAFLAAFGSPILRHGGGDFIGIAACYTLEAAAACCVLLWAIESSSGMVRGWLNSPSLAHIGVLSYSLYLWQQIWLCPEFHWPSWTVPFLIAASLLSAELSYRLVEAPMLALRAQLRRRVDLA